MGVAGDGAQNYGVKVGTASGAFYLGGAYNRNIGDGEIPNIRRFTSMRHDQVLFLEAPVE